MVLLFQQWEMHYSHYSVVATGDVELCLRSLPDIEIVHSQLLSPRHCLENM